jgi:hypothetical protein
MYWSVLNGLNGQNGLMQQYGLKIEHDWILRWNDGTIGSLITLPLNLQFT